MIRDIQLKDKDQWERLYKGYADFYKVKMNNKILQTVWNWLHDKNHEVNGIVYEVEDKAVQKIYPSIRAAKVMIPQLEKLMKDNSI